MFGQTQANSVVSAYINRNNLNVPSLRSTMANEEASAAKQRADPVNMAMDVLNQPLDTFEKNAVDHPYELAGTLFLAMAASIAAPGDGDIPNAFKSPEPSGLVSEISLRQTLEDLRTLMTKDYAMPITQGFIFSKVSTIKAQIQDRVYEMAITRGCFEVTYRVLNVNVRTIWSRAERNSCRG